MPQISIGERVAAFEEGYQDRARGELGGRLDGVAAISFGRSEDPADVPGPIMAGWWSDPGSDWVVLPNPWDDRDAIALYEEHCWEVTQCVLAELAPRLDAVVGEQRGKDAWGWILAPWLLHTVSAIADRRLYCLTAAELAPDGPFMAIAPNGAPTTLGEAVERLRTELGNRDLMSQIAGWLNLPVKLTTATREFAVASSREMPRARGPRRAGAALLSTPIRRRVSLLGHVGLTPREYLRLVGRAAGARLERPASVAGPPPQAGPEAPALRAKLVPAGVGDPADLGHLVMALLPRMIPRSVLEGHAEFVTYARHRYGAPTHLVLGNYAADEVQNEHVARCVAAGRRIAFAQHGGFYLQARVNAQERLEVRPCCDFLSWGAEGPAVRPLPSPRLERIRGSHAGGDTVVIVEFLEPPDAYPLRFASQPMANQAYAPSALLAGLVEATSVSREHLVLKRFPSHLDAHRRRLPVLEALPHDFAPGGAVEWMRQARVAVIPYPDTPFIEALVLGVPTIGLWDRSLWELRDDARGPFDALFEADVIHEDPRAAAAHLDAVYADPAGWWDAPATRAARDTFIQRFARPGDWLTAWSGYLRELGA